MPKANFPNDTTFVGCTRLMEGMRVGESTLSLTKNATSMQAALKNLIKSGRMPETAKFTQKKLISWTRPHSMLGKF